MDALKRQKYEMPIDWKLSNQVGKWTPDLTIPERNLATPNTSGPLRPVVVCSLPLDFFWPLLQGKTG